MPLKLTVGLSRKVGQPNYGSIGATCGVEVELENALLIADPETFQLRVRDAFDACTRAVDDELGRQRPRSAGPTGEGCDDGRHGEGRRADLPLRSRPATAAQVRALAHLARRDGLDLGASSPRGSASTVPRS